MAKPPKPKTWYGKTWYFVWHDDSLLSWIINIILAFILIKFVVYPGLGFFFGTQFPIVAVVSESMEHQGKFDAWWSDNKDFYLKNNITQAQFELYPFHNGFGKGDIMILVGKDPYEIGVGQVIVYQSGKPYPIIHRVIHVQEKSGKYYFETKGDNNGNQIVDIDLDETNIPEDVVYGKAVARVPYLGYVKIWFVDLINLILR
ncbi:signal peptidase I [Nanoarchaeota archaeon]